MNARKVLRVPAGATAVILLATPASGDGLPASMNFQDATFRIVETIPEQVDNWKFVDAGDFDQDGDLDVVIANAWIGSTRRNKLYRNDGVELVEISDSALIPGFVELCDPPSGCNAASVGATFADLDGDGWLDIVIVNDFQSSLSQRTRLYMNRQTGGQFSHFQEESLERLPDLGLMPGSTAAAVFDADNDGDQDLFVASENQDLLLFNDGAGYFTDVTLTNLPLEPPESPYWAIDVSAADLNGDCMTDLLITNFGLTAPIQCPSGDCPSFIYYNGLGGGAAGFDIGDFGGLVDSIPPSGDAESAIAVAFLDGGGTADYYRGNLTPRLNDFVYRNTGNDEEGRALFEEAMVEQQVSFQLSCKPVSADLNQDGRPEIIVTAAGTHPTILRNTSVGGTISFVDWSPRPAFPPGMGLAGWDVAVLDSNNDGDLDIFLAGYEHDHLFEQIPGQGVDEADLPDGQLPAIFNADPLAVRGRVGEGTTDVYELNGIGPQAFLSLVLNGPDDYRLQVLDSSGHEIGGADRGGPGVEEALQVDASGTVFIHVSNLEAVDDPAAAADINQDGFVDVVDLLGVILGWGPCPAACSADVDGSGAVDVGDLVAVLLAWGPVPLENDYVLELLARD